MTIQPLTPFTGLGPLTNITPFTYRDNANYLFILRNLVKVVNENIDLTNKNFDDLIAEFNTEISGALAEWLAKFNEFMDDVVEQLEGLNDEAMANLLVDPETQTGQAFLELTADFARIVEPNILYVDPLTGSDDNEGSVAQPFATIAKAFELIERNAQKKATEWVINCSSGSFTERVRPASFTPFAYKVTIQGPPVGHPGTPAVLFTEGQGTSAVGMFFTNPLSVITVKDVAFSGYNGTTSSCGILNSEGTLYTENVHVEYCYWGISSQHGTLDVKGGIIDNNGRLNGEPTGNGGGIRSLFQNHHSIGTQNAGNNTLGPIFTNNTSGVFAQESSTGHVDWCTFEDNVHGVQLNVNSRSNVDGSLFKRNANGINARGNSHAFISPNTTFGSSVDRNGQNAVIAGGSQAPTDKAIDVDMSYARTEQVFWGDYDQQIFTGSVATQTVLSHVLEGNWWNDTVQASGTAPKRVMIRAWGNIAGSADIKRVNFEAGSLVGGFTLTATETGPFIFEATIVFASPTRQVVSAKFIRHLAETTRVAVISGSQDFSNNVPLELVVSTDNATDSITFETIELLFG